MNEELLSLLGATPEQIAQARQRSGFEELGLLGQALSAAGAPAPRGTSTLGRLGQAARTYTQAPRQTMDTLLQDLLRKQQIQDMQKKRAAETTRQTAIERLRPTLSEQEQLLFEAAPSEFIGKRIESQFREQPESFRQLTDPEKQSMNLPVTKNFQVSSKSGRVTEIGGGGTNVKVEVPVSLSTEKKFGEVFATKVAEEDVKLRDSALAAPAQLDTIQQTKSLLEQGRIFTGKFANEKLALAAAGQALGVTGADTNEVVANTERLFANRAKATLDNVRNSGLGAGQGFTDRDREFLEKAVLGNISFTAESLKRQLEIEEKVARGSVTKWNNRFKQLPKSTVEATGITPVDIAAPRLEGGQQAAPSSSGGSLQDAARRELERRRGQ
jgi:hypothetical protein